MDADAAEEQVCSYLPLHFKRILLTILTCPPHILTFKNSSLWRDSDVADLGSAAGTALAAQRDVEREGLAATAVGSRGGAGAAVPREGVSGGGTAAAAPPRVFAIGQLEDAARRLRAATALGSDGHAAALLDNLDATVARLKRMAS